MSSSSSQFITRSSSQCHPQLFEAEPKPALDGAQRQIQCRGYLQVRQALVIRHLDRTPLFFGEPRQGRSHFAARNRLKHTLGEVGAYLFDLREVYGDLPCLLTSFHSQSIDRLVVYEGQDERVEPSASGVDPVCLSPDGEQGFLDGVFCGRAVAENPIGKTKGLTA